MFEVKVDLHISRLLYQHDCVIVPGFGGFVTNSQPARIHPVQHQFYPPSKKVGFNIHLKRNDGLLANSISQNEAVSYEEALKLITEFVNNCNDNLSNGKSYSIDNVGKLYFDVEKHLRFEADTNVNYLLDSFGLTTIQSPPIKRESLKDKIEKQVKYREPIKAENKTVSRRKFPWKAALILPVIGLFVWASVQTINVYTNKIDKGYINPFENKKPSSTETDLQIPPVNIPQPNEDEANVVNEETNISTDIQPEEIIDPVVVEESKISEPAAPTILTDKKYFIIAGAFAVPENAEKLISQLKQKGFNNAAIVDTTKQGLHVVAYNDGFSAYADALQNLNELKSMENPGAWLLKK